MCGKRNDTETNRERESEEVKYSLADLVSIKWATRKGLENGTITFPGAAFSLMTLLQTVTLKNEHTQFYDETTLVRDDTTKKRL